VYNKRTKPLKQSIKRFEKKKISFKMAMLEKTGKKIVEKPKRCVPE
jgi:hypothetical protein